MAEHALSSDFVRRRERPQKLPVRLSGFEEHIVNDTPPKKQNIDGSTSTTNQNSNTFPPPISLRRKRKRQIELNNSAFYDSPANTEPLGDTVKTPSEPENETVLLSVSHASSLASELKSSNDLENGQQSQPATFPTSSSNINLNEVSSTEQENKTQPITPDTNENNEDDDQIDCSVDDLLPSNTKDSESDLDYDGVLEAVKNKADRKAQLLKHLAGAIQERKDVDMRNYKLLLPNIASNFQRTELRSFLTNHFQSVSCVDAKEKKKRAAELKKQQTQKPEVHYADEIRMMMHAFGDVAQAEIESAKYLDFIIKRFITTLVTSIKEVLPHNPIKPYKVNAEVLYVALLPDLKKIYRVQQAIRHLIQSRSLKRTEQTANTNNNNANANDGADVARGTATVPELENLLEQVSIPLPRNASNLSSTPSSSSSSSASKPDEAASVLFDTPYWRARLASAGQQAEADKLERHQMKDRLSQQVPAAGFVHFMQCTSASFTKPHRKKMLDYMKAHCGLGSLEMTGKVVEMIGLLTYDMLMELVVGTLQRKQALQLGTGPLAPIHIYGFMESLSQQFAKNESNTNNNNSSSSGK